MKIIDNRKKSIIILNMKRLFILILSLFVLSNVSFAENYDALYDSAELFQSKLYNDIDPFQDEDNLRYSWSPYPLFRTSANLYFKDLNIEPGYYLLTPRKLSGKDYVLFKQNGKVVFIVPVAKKEATPLNFYEANTPQVKLTKWQKFTKDVRKKFYDTAKNSGRSTPPSSLVDVEVEVKYIIVRLYYGDDKYTLLFKRSPY